MALKGGDTVSSTAKIEGAAQQLLFILGGRAEFTIRNPETGGRFTYRVAKGRSGKPPYFVRVLTGPDNHSHFEMLGLIDGHLIYRRARSSRVGEFATSARAFRWMWKRLVTHKGIAPAEFWHTGRCGICGRKLTVPESIASGIGPRCAARLAA